MFQDGRLLSGDHILQIGDVNLRGMGSEQVAAVLRQAGTNVRLVVARPVDASVAAGVEGLAAPVVPTRILADADEVRKPHFESPKRPRSMTSAFRGWREGPTPLSVFFPQFRM